MESSVFAAIEEIVRPFGAATWRNGNEGLRRNESSHQGKTRAQLECVFLGYRAPESCVLKLIL